MTANQRIAPARWHLLSRSFRRCEPSGRLGTFSSEPFLRSAEFSLQPRLYYRDLHNSSGSQEAFAAGGALSLTTGWWRDTLQLGVTGYTTQPVFAPNGAGNTGLLRPDGEGLSVLGQAWARVKYGPATATFFRQALQLPFINGNDSRMIPNTFEAYQLESGTVEKPPVKCSAMWRK